VLREQPSCLAISLIPSPLRAITRISTACSWVNIDGQKAAIVAQVGHFYSGAVGQFYIGANMYCRDQRPAPWQAPSKGVRALQALVARLDTLQAIHQAESNRLDVAHESGVPSIRQVLTDLEMAITQVKAQISKTVDDDPDLKRRAELLETIPGLGERTIPQLLAYIGSPERFKSAKALAAYARLAPMVRQSGTSLDQRRGTHPMGHKRLKSLLYFPAMVAGTYNPAVRALWTRMKAQNKPGKVIVEACMHKLLAIAYGVLRSGKPFDPEHGCPIPA
jgi:transposase